MSPLEMIAEWRKGCANIEFGKEYPDHPEYCPKCTRALIDALERKLKEISCK